MSGEDERQRGLRKEISGVAADKTLTPSERARRIQALMSREWAAAAAASPSPSPSPSDATEAAAVAEAMATPSFHDDAHTVFGCRHYARGCRIVAPCCGKVFPCRLCHDEAEDHPIDRFKIARVVCCRCHTLQPASERCCAPQCAGEPRPFARYYCAICKLWDDDEAKHIYHCDGCGICRIGRGLGIDRQHCDVCGICYDISFFAEHPCHPKKLEGECAVCRQRLFDSVRPVSFMRCGHSIHAHCLDQLVHSGNFRCPLCNKSVGDMARTWTAYDRYIARLPMPEEWSETRARIACNDCSEKGETKFHFAGLKCPNCGGYNTTMLDLLNAPTVEQQEAAEKRRREEEQHQQHQPVFEEAPLEDDEDEDDDDSEDEDEDDSKEDDQQD